MATLHPVLSFALLFTLAAAVCDLRSGQIPNRLTLGALLSGGALQVGLLCWAAGPVGLGVLAAALARTGGRRSFAINTMSMAIGSRRLPKLLADRSGV